MELVKLACALACLPPWSLFPSLCALLLLLPLSLLLFHLLHNACAGKEEEEEEGEISPPPLPPLPKETGRGTPLRTMRISLIRNSGQKAPFPLKDSLPITLRDTLSLWGSSSETMTAGVHVQGLLGLVVAGAYTKRTRIS